MGADTDLQSRMARALDLLEIEQCLYRYASGIDRHDLDLAMSAYHSDALDDHGFFVGRAGDFVQRTPRAHEVFAAHQHYIVNHRIELSGEQAHGEVYWMMVARERTGDHVTASGGRYIDRYERRDGVWRIAARVCIVEWTSREELVPVIFSAFQAARQDRSDLAYLRPLAVERTFRDTMPEFQRSSEGAD